jgi:formylglycine-generating enzyme required for sulfatase activity
VTGANASAVRSGRQPVEQVTWDEAVAFCEALSARDAEKAAGRFYRLPTEAEWEYCCRAGAPGSFALGPTITPRQANFRGSGLMGTTPIGTYPPNAWGLFDFHGNVSEWCADWYGLDSYATGAAIDPFGPEEGTKRVVRGGAWNSPVGDCRSAKRFDLFAQDYRGRDVGFRVACGESNEEK